MKLLVVSDRSPEEDSTNFLLSELRKCINVEVINTKNKPEKTTIIDRVLHKIQIEIDKSNINARLLEKVSETKYDALFIMRGNRLKPDTVKQLSKKTYLVGYSGDNMCRWFNRTRNYMKGLKYYNLLFAVNVPAYKEIEKYTDAEVIYFNKCASKKIHVPKAMENENKIYDVTFIGTYEKERACALYNLARKGIRIEVWGNNWTKNIYTHANLKIRYTDIVGHEYATVLRKSKIVIGFLRKANGDTQTSRSFEITACGTFALLERTDEHLQLYREGVEIECFESDDELQEKIIYYLSDEISREKIANCGYLRVVQSEYYFDSLAKNILINIRSRTKNVRK